MSEAYWKRRAAVVEERNRALELEIRRLRGFKPLSAEWVEGWNRGLTLRELTKPTLPDRKAGE